MNKLTLFGTTLGHPPTTHDSTIPSREPYERSRLAPHRRTAVQLIAEHDIKLPGWEALTLIVEAALTSRDLFFTAALQRPDERELQDVFQDFVLRRVTQANPVTQS